MSGWISRTVLVLSLLLIGWIVWDFRRGPQKDLRRFDPAEVARLDTDMWRSYYERKPVTLFFQLAEIMQTQYQAPFWRSYAIAFRAARAAFLFKDGRNRAHYERALPELERYFAHLSALSSRPFDVRQAARLELEWWIVRREGNRYSAADWERLLAQEAAVLYHRPAGQFRTHARYRVQAMRYRDARRNRMTEADWLHIRHLLQQSWTAMYQVVN